MNIRAREVVCPQCRQEHVAGTDDDGPLWFTCRKMLYEIPDEFDKLGTQAWIDTQALDRNQTTGCLGCGRDVDCTDKEAGDGYVRWICYRCGTVGRYWSQYRQHQEDPEPPLFVAPIPTVQPTTMGAIHDALVHMQATDDWQVVHEPGGPLTMIPAPRSGSTAHDSLPRPEQIDGSGVVPRLQRTKLRALRWLTGLD